jgi:hypothetical protein
MLNGRAILGIWATLFMEEKKMTNNFLEIRRPSCAERKFIFLWLTTNFIETLFFQAFTYINENRDVLMP